MKFKNKLEVNKMKLEPLNNKLNNEDGTFFYFNVKSAVEWLKEEIKQKSVVKGSLIYNLIDKAFEDVIKNNFPLEE